MYYNFNYTSCIRLHGVPLLPPIISEKERLENRRYKELAIEKEKTNKQKQKQAARRLVTSQSSCENESPLSYSRTDLDTSVVMEFIQNVLRDFPEDSGAVRKLERDILNELRVAAPERCPSSDTLHNCEDIVSVAETVITPSGVDVEPLTEPRLSLVYSHKTPDKEPSPSSDCPKLIRSNSYTLESPSPSVLLYLKSLREPSSPPKASSSARKNLNNCWGSPDPEFDSAKDSPEKPDTTPNNDETNGIFMTSSLELQSNRRNFVLENNSTSVIEAAAARIQAGVRGYLTRRLLKTHRVIELKNAIRDSLITALQLHSEDNVSQAELDLHKKLLQQIESMCCEWHSIFFDYSPQERMRLIQIDRQKLRNPPKPPKPFLRRSQSRSSGRSTVKNKRPSSLPLSRSTSSMNSPA